MNRFLWGDEVNVRRAVTQQQAYIAGCDQAVEDARLALRPVMHDAEAYREALAKWRGLRVLAREARLNAYGVDCPCCLGAMEVSTGRTPWDAKTCPVCRGDGRLLPDEADSVTEWGERADDDNAYDREGDR